MNNRRNERSDQLHVRMSPREVAMVRELAERDGITVSDVVRGLLRRAHHGRADELLSITHGRPVA
jgi:propanediol dehydratase large subunit